MNSEKSFCTNCFSINNDMRQSSTQDAAHLADESFFVPHVHKRAATGDNTCGGCHS